MPEADGLVDVEPELGRLDADLAVDLGVLDPGEQLEVVVHDRLGPCRVGDRLAELGVQRPDTQDLEVHGGAEGVRDVGTGHQPADGTLHERHPHQPVAQPVAPGEEQEDLAQQAVDHRRSNRSTGTTNTVAPPTSTSSG